MKQLGKTRSIIYHLYPGILITLGFIILAPLSIQYGYPPQFGMLAAIVIVAIPVLLLHLCNVKKQEGANNISRLNGLTNRLPMWRLILYSLGLVAAAFIIWGITQPLDLYISHKFFKWLPTWYTVQDFAGYDTGKVKITLALNLLLNGILAPYAEEFYFRGYLLARMTAWGKYAFVINAVFFSLYHFWQPYIYLTLILALLPMIFMVYKTRDIRLGILTHSLLNIIGAILSLVLLCK
jgi:membrane protease YdiL (CAAX protease family)